MEVLVRTFRTTTHRGDEVLANEYWEMVDHSPFANGTGWLPGPRRYRLSTGEPLRWIDETTFQVEVTGQILTVTSAKTFA